MFWKIVYQGKNSAIHKLIVSISYVYSCLAWSYSKGGSLPENCNQSVQSHALSLILRQRNCGSFISSSLPAGFIFAMLFLLSFPLCHMQQVSRSFQPPVFGVPGVSRGETVPEQQPLQGLCLQGLCSLHSAMVPPHCFKHITWQSLPLCDLSDTVLPGAGDTRVPWFVAQLKIKLCMRDTGDGAWSSRMKLLGVSSSRSQGLSLWSQLTPASFIWTLCPGGEKLKHERVSPPRLNFLPGKSIVLPQTRVTVQLDNYDMDNQGDRVWVQALC